MKSSIYLKRVIISLLSLMVCVVALELALRVSGYHGINIDFEPVEYSPSLGWALRPNYAAQWEFMEWSFPYRTNSRGFRDEEHDVEKAGSVKRIVVIGDSYAEGYGLSAEDMWQAKLSGKLATDVEMLNFGVRAYDLIQEYKQFIEVGLSYDPDLVLLMLCDNDIGHDVPAPLHDRHRYFRPSYELHDDTIVFRTNVPKRAIVFEHDRTWRVVKKMLYRSASVVWCRRHIKGLLAVGGQGASELSREATVLDYDKLYPQAVEAIFSEFKRLGEQHGFGVVVAWVGPTAMPDTLVETIAETTGFQVNIDLPSALRFRHDIHPNPTGAEKIANDIYTLLSDRAQFRDRFVDSQ